MGEDTHNPFAPAIPCPVVLEGSEEIVKMEVFHMAKDEEKPPRWDDETKYNNPVAKEPEPADVAGAGVVGEPFQSADDV